LRAWERQTGNLGVSKGQKWKKKGRGKNRKLKAHQREFRRGLWEREVQRGQIPQEKKVGVVGGGVFVKGNRKRKDSWEKRNTVKSGGERKVKYCKENKCQNTKSMNKRTLRLWFFKKAGHKKGLQKKGENSFNRIKIGVISKTTRVKGAARGKRVVGTLGSTEKMRRGGGKKKSKNVATP